MEKVEVVEAVAAVAAVEQSKQPESSDSADSSASIASLATFAHASSVRSVPPHNWRAHWLTVTEFSRIMDRSPWTVQTWIRNGTLAEFGIPVYQLRLGRAHSGRTFIQNIY